MRLNHLPCWEEVLIKHIIHREGSWDVGDVDSNDARYQAMCLWNRRQLLLKGSFVQSLIFFVLENAWQLAVKVQVSNRAGTGTSFTATPARRPRAAPQRAGSTDVGAFRPGG